MYFTHYWWLWSIGRINCQTKQNMLLLLLLIIIIKWLGSVVVRASDL